MKMGTMILFKHRMIWNRLKWTWWMMIIKKLNLVKVMIKHSRTIGLEILKICLIMWSMQFKCQRWGLSIHLFILEWEIWNSKLMFINSYFKAKSLDFKKRFSRNKNKCSRKELVFNGREKFKKLKTDNKKEWRDFKAQWMFLMNQTKILKSIKN